MIMQCEGLFNLQGETIIVVCQYRTMKDKHGQIDET